jgi:hypothetical protein
MPPDDAAHAHSPGVSYNVVGLVQIRYGQESRFCRDDTLLCPINTKLQSKAVSGWGQPGG